MGQYKFYSLVLFCNNTTSFVYLFVLQLMEYQNKRGGRIKLHGIMVSSDMFKMKRARAAVDESLTQELT